ncbi:HEAT repeat domain-containing protein [Paenisporosarcina cavernae]|uniref:HEAT repeat domain-containing protein n=1 Tax=Paenisporosarcina cavernae TaxID=2320858 RepID=A0A385YQ08_9BACL|nr:HEAT repeat domain-containing protein [Paenisporosarcina cavernae]AYC28829.1 HEAT repeat domain-containing protein [Paenisporosarcina cavernae]
MWLSSTLLVNFIIVLLVLLGIFSFYLTILSMLQTQSRKKQLAYMDRSKWKWMDYLYHDGDFEEAMIPTTRDEMKAAEKLLVSFLNAVYVEGTQYKIRKFANQYMTTYYRRMLTSPEWSIRMNALYRVLDFYLIDLAEEYMTFYKKKKVRNREESYYFTLVQLMIGKVQPYQFLLDDSRHYTEQQIRAIVKKLSDRQLKDLSKHYDYLNQQTKLAFFDVLAETYRVDYEPFMVEKLETEKDFEVHLRILKSFQTMGYASSFEPFLPYLASSSWEERMVAAKIVGSFPVASTSSYLLPLLEDDNWWVRSVVASTLATHKNGSSVLNDFAHQTKDRYAAEMISEQLWKKAMA